MGKAGKIVVGLYLALCAASLALIPLSGEALAGVYAILLAMPWSLMIGRIVTDSVLANAALISVGFLLNAAILAALFRWLGGGASGRR